MAKNIMIFCCEKELNKIFDYITIENKNSLISFNSSEGKFYFKSYYSTQKEELTIRYSVLLFNEELVNNICIILKKSFSQIQEIAPNEPSGPFKEPNIYSEIINYVNVCSYEFNEPDSIFDFVANLFYRYLTGHKMINGNKRLSLVFLINILRYFGYHFYWSKGIMINYKSHEKIVEEWVKESHSITNETRNDFIKKISNWIKSNSVIALEWR